jgi:hypothetical protein
MKSRSLSPHFGFMTGRLKPLRLRKFWGEPMTAPPNMHEAHLFFIFAFAAHLTQAGGPTFLNDLLAAPER